VAEEHFVDLARADLFTATINQFLDAAGERQVAFSIKNTLISCPEPPVGKGLRVRIGIVFIT
jgi:hypothetical protein